MDEDWFTAYHSYEDHIQWLNDLQAAHKDNSEIVVAGSSYEDRNITGIHMWGSEGKDKKPAAIFHGTVHAREWIATMVGTLCIFVRLRESPLTETMLKQVTEYIANSLISDPDSQDILDRFDFYFFPVVNPDGTFSLPLSFETSTERIANVDTRLCFYPD